MENIFKRNHLSTSMYTSAEIPGNKYKGLFSFFHKSKSEDGDGYARMFGLKNGLDNSRFTQYKNTGIF